MPPQSETRQLRDDRVAVIVGRKFCTEMEALIYRMPVWAPDKVHYRQIAECVRGALGTKELTLFTCDDSLSPEEEFLSMLSTVDLHHGEYSVNPWTTLEVYGANCTDDITAALGECGVETILQTDYGFSASRVPSLPKPIAD